MNKRADMPKEDRDHWLMLMLGGFWSGMFGALLGAIAYNESVSYLGNQIRICIVFGGPAWAMAGAMVAVLVLKGVRCIAEMSIQGTRVGVAVLA